MNPRRRGGLGRGLGALLGPQATDGGALDDIATESELPPSPDSGSTSPQAEPESTAGRPADDVAVERSVVAPEAPDDSRSPETAETGPTDESAEALVQVPGVRLAELPLDSIRANPRQPRSVFDEESLAELTHSVREFGVLQPVVVRPVPGGYELVMGERRLRASAAAGLNTIPAIVRDTADEALLRDALLENIHRVQLNPLEEAAAYQQLLEEFDVTHDELAGRLGRSRSHVTNTVRLLNLSVPAQRRVAAGVLSAGHARALLSLPAADDQDELAGRIVAEGLSVRATEEIVALATSRGSLTFGSRRRTPTQRMSAPAADDLAERLSDALDTRVRVEIGRRKGRVVVEFATVADLERIVAIMAPEAGRPANAPDEAAAPAAPAAPAAAVEAPGERTSDYATDFDDEVVQHSEPAWTAASPTAASVRW
jgi:ParB family transcriptional regulator, chromosome partitioning protein